jgi:hypothetical protein
MIVRRLLLACVVATGCGNTNGSTNGTNGQGQCPHPGQLDCSGSSEAIYCAPGANPMWVNAGQCPFCAQRVVASETVVRCGNANYAVPDATCGSVDALACALGTGNITDERILKCSLSTGTSYTWQAVEDCATSGQSCTGPAPYDQQGTNITCK